MLCEHDYRDACVSGVNIHDAATCMDSDGDGRAGDHYNCGVFGTLRVPGPTTLCGADQCTFGECCVTLQAECARPMFAAGVRVGFGRIVASTKHSLETLSESNATGPLRTSLEHGSD